MPLKSKRCSIFFFLSKYFPKHKLPENVVATNDAKAALLGADYCLHAVPVQVGLEILNLFASVNCRSKSSFFKRVLSCRNISLVCSP